MLEDCGRMCREFALAAAAGLFGTLPGEVGAGVVADPARRSQIEVDDVVFVPTIPGEPRRILSLGEAKWAVAIVIDACALAEVEALFGGQPLIAPI